MILEQHYLSCLSQVSYLLGDERTKTAVVVDPRRDGDLYLERATELGLEIRHVFLTHFHADFVSGHLELRERTGAEIHVGAGAQADQGTLVLDVRDPDAYAARHLRGSVNIGLGGRFASWCGTVLGPEEAIVLVAEQGRETEAAVRLGRVGFDHVIGYLDGGPAALERAPEALASHPRISAEDLGAQLEGETPPRVIDVRLPAEWDAGHIPGSHNLPLQQLEEGLQSLRRGEPLVIQCQSGYRSSIAASLLERHGFAGLQDLQGGWLAWDQAHSGSRG